MEDEFVSKVKRLVANYHRVKFVDYYSENKLDLLDQHFYDPLHLNRLGGEIFTREIGRFVVEEFRQSSSETDI